MCRSRAGATSERACTEIARARAKSSQGSQSLRRSEGAVRCSRYVQPHVPVSRPSLSVLHICFHCAYLSAERSNFFHIPYQLCSSCCASPASMISVTCDSYPLYIYFSSLSGCNCLWMRAARPARVGSLAGSSLQFVLLDVYPVERMLASVVRCSREVRAVCCSNARCRGNSHGRSFAPLALHDPGPP